jgi:hypothetical protein
MNDDLDFSDGDGPTVAGIRAYRTVYYFFHGQLFKIQSELPGSQYRELRTAFVGKYGAPIRRVTHYQNSFGAQSSGEELRWQNATSQINIGELDAESNNVLLTIRHTNLEKEYEAAAAVKDPEKDL